ncbi:MULTISPECIES: WXG100 family type VII secretion target [unclassified Amycolatopsis]|uniref:WXG100 family type VII secretion target n=1 Tax=unclassified Amycolatopsis TaxID=2618356 RepID=UPI000262615E|nr:WXG100 family type VII secretion target [Amycolatopsis sp. ATCC 39116]
MTGNGLMDANTETLTRVVQMAAVVVQEIESQRGKLDGEVNSVIPAQWSMDQSQSLLVAHKKWDAAIRNLCEKLQKLGEDTQFAVNDYMDVDQQGARCFNGADSGSGFGGSGFGSGFGSGGLGSGFGGTSGGGDGSGQTYAFAGVLRAL